MYHVFSQRCISGNIGFVVSLVLFPADLCFCFQSSIIGFMFDINILVKNTMVINTEATVTMYNCEFKWTCFSSPVMYINYKSYVTLNCHRKKVK